MIKESARVVGRGERVVRGAGLGSVAGAGGGSAAAAGVALLLVAEDRNLSGGAGMMTAAVLVAVLFGLVIGAVAGALGGLVVGVLRAERAAPAVGAGAAVGVGWAVAGDLVAGLGGAAAMVVVLGPVGWFTGCWFRRAIAGAGDPAPAGRAELGPGSDSGG
ncbi:MAG: hypothetical protein R2761_10990 [Acidimicrobiales bacterium]